MGSGGESVPVERGRLRLFDLDTDPGEAHDVVGDHPDVVERLLSVIGAGRIELGDDATQVVGSDVRPIGRVDDPVTLTTYDEHAAYYMAEYDLPERG